MRPHTQRASRSPRTTQPDRTLRHVRRPPSVQAAEADRLALQRAVADPSRASARDIAALQAAYGNRAVTGLLRSAGIQAKLVVGAVGDQYEQEADHVAERVMNMPAPGASSLAPTRAGQGVPAAQRQEEEELQMKPIEVQRQEEEELQMKPVEVQRQEEEEEPIQPKRVEGIQRQEEEELQMKPAEGIQRQEEEELQMKPVEVQRQEEEEEPLQPKRVETIQRREDGSFEAGKGLETRLAAQKGGGSPLPSEVRSFMEPRFGADFSSVRVHTGSQAVQMNHEINAQAFTHGNDIYFSSNKYSPGTESGKRLLAHELTHTIQQTGRADRISRWGGLGNTTSHVTVTEDAFKSLGPVVSSWYSDEAKEYLAHMSEQMDLRAGFLAGVVTGKIMQKFGSMSTNPDAYDNLQGYWRPTSEAPNHAEGGMYKGDGSAIDLDRIDKYIASAVEAWGKKDQRQALSVLALGLHTAEDRGAHGDGRPGTGHDPRRLIPPPEGAKTNYYIEGWKGTDCDLKDKNPDGYAFAVEQAKRVLMIFAGKIGGLGGGRKGLSEFTKPGMFKGGMRKLGMFFGKDIIKT